MASGLVYLHRVPLALVPHVEWTIAGVCGNQIPISWHPSLEGVSERASVVSYSGAPDAGSILATAFMNLKSMTFEVTQDPTGNDLGFRWSYSPSLGFFHASTDGAGNILLSENQIRAALVRAGDNPLKIQAEFRRLLGQAWDDELESFREKALVIGTESNNGVVPTEAERIAYGQNVRPL